MNALVCALRTVAALLLVAVLAVACGGNDDVPSAGSSTSGGSARSQITRLDITSRVSPAFGGTSFGAAGQYELLIGKAYGAADPLSPRNAQVTDLAGAPRNATGLVEYNFDVAILKPIDVSKADGTLVHEVSNRGRQFLIPLHLLGGNGDFTSPAGAGNVRVGLDQGYTMVWTGWQGDFQSTVNASGVGMMAARLPTATGVDGKPIVQTVVDEFLLDASTGGLPAVAKNATFMDVPLSFTPAVADASKFTLTVQERADDIPVTLPSTQMAFTTGNTVRVQLAPGYDLGAVYHISYQAINPLVAGLGSVSMRDLVSMLRYSATDGAGTAHPLSLNGKSIIQRTIDIGISQSGRFVKDFLYRDFNADEQGRPVFDGMIPSGSGAKRGYFVERFAQPGKSPDVQHENRGYPGASFPFTYPTLDDPVTGKTDGLLKLCTASRTCPKIMQTDSDWEQWQQLGSLVVTDTLGRPLQLPDNVRSYVFAGTPHFITGTVANGTFTSNSAVCANLANPLNWAPIYRALMVAMVDWLKTGTLPPPSQNPSTLADGRVSIETLANMYPAIPGYTFSRLYGKPQLIDFTKDPWQVISTSAPYPASMLRVNPDGNEYDGIVMPELAVPIATYSGRTTRNVGYAAGDLCATSGASFPFAKTQAERLSNGDPRPSIAERYTSNADYRAKLAAAASQLVQKRLMLQGDADRYASFVLPQ